ncbi:hypothetical protein C8Q77DRAFT_1115362, partial [Trametes polyzona]
GGGGADDIVARPKGNVLSTSLDTSGTTKGTGPVACRAPAQRLTALGPWTTSSFRAYIHARTRAPGGATGDRR